MTRFAALALALLAGATPAAAQKLTIGAAAPATSLDPHFYNSSPTTNVATHFFDMLVARDAQARPVAALAESWQAVSDTAWEFKLRPGVTWHDGRDFTAEDVVFSLARVPAVPNSPGSFAPMVRAIIKVEVIDPLTVRLHTAAPHPLLPNELGSIFMVSKHAGEGKGTEDYNSGRAMIGTGPYRLASYVAGDRVEMLRNDAHWAGRPAWTTSATASFPMTVRAALRCWPATSTSWTRCRPPMLPGCGRTEECSSARSLAFACSTCRWTIPVRPSRPL
jgi:peptide/nickel transport system substrate-binding protein